MPALSQQQSTAIDVAIDFFDKLRDCFSSTSSIPDR